MVPSNFYCIGSFPALLYQKVNAFALGVRRHNLTISCFEDRIKYMKLLQDLKLHTLQLISFDKEKHIESLFSGCLLLFRNFSFVLSVAHGLKNKDSKVAIIMHNIPTLHYLPNWKPFNPTRLRQFRTRVSVNLSKILVILLKSLRIRIDYMSILLKYIGGIDFMSSIVLFEYIPIHSLPVNSELLGLPKQYFNENQIVEPNINYCYNFYGISNLRVENSQQPPPKVVA
jgi:hypothetical protein